MSISIIFPVSVRPVFPDDVVKSTSTNVHRNRATTAEAVPIYRKAIVANVQPATRARIVKRSRAIV